MTSSGYLQRHGTGPNRAERVSAGLCELIFRIVDEFALLGGLSAELRGHHIKTTGCK
jgi:hypothetical protein